jgi:multidrug efflux pump subunit AcrA (membrane-fusion protein)
LVDLGSHRDALVVSAKALRTAWTGGSEVVACEAGKARVYAVDVGTRESERVEILRGLIPTARVVVDNVVGLADGAPLTEAP